MLSSKIKNLNLNTNNVITVDKLKIAFGKKKNEKVLIEEFSHTFEKGKIYFIIGNSGVGKTTLVSHFNGLMKSKYGNIFVNDCAIIGKQRKIKKYKKLRKNIGLVFQFPEYQLFKDTIEKDIAFGPRNFGVKKDQANKLAKKYLNLMGLGDEYLQHSPFELSGGQKRRVAIAGILAIEPSIMIFDEPTAGLDPVGERQMLDIILDLKKQGKTVIVITHNMDQVLELGDEVLLLHDGKILRATTPYELFLDNKVMSQTKMAYPKVINTINQLVRVDSKFKKLYDLKPKTVDELASAIDSILKKGGK